MLLAIHHCIIYQNTVWGGKIHHFNFILESLKFLCWSVLLIRSDLRQDSALDSKHIGPWKGSDPCLMTGKCGPGTWRVRTKGETLKTLPNLCPCVSMPSEVQCTQEEKQAAVKWRGDEEGEKMILSLSDSCWTKHNNDLCCILNSVFATFVFFCTSLSYFSQDKYYLCFLGTVIFKGLSACSGFCMPFGSSVYLQLSQHSFWEVDCLSCH